MFAHLLVAVDDEQCLPAVWHGNGEYIMGSGVICGGHVSQAVCPDQDDSRPPICRKSFDVVVIGAGTGGYVAAIRAVAAWQDGRRRRETERTRWHVSDLGMHSDQGASRTRPCVEGDSAGVRVGRDDSVRHAHHQHDAGARPQGQDRRRAHQGHRVPVQEEQDHLGQGHGTARRSGQGRSRRWRQADARGERDHHRDRLGAAQCSRPSPSITRASSRATRPFTSRKCPKSLVILGSGAVGVEFASIYRRFGSEVTIIELVQRLVPVEDEAVSAELEKSFKKQGITVLTGTKVTKATVIGERREHRGRNARRQDEEDCRRHVARRHRPWTGHDRAWASKKLASRWSAATSRSTISIARRCRECLRSATSSRSEPACTRSLRTCRRWKV